MLPFTYDGDYTGLLEFLEGRLASYLTPEDVPDPPSGVPRAVYDHFPFHFGNKFPAQGVSHLSDEGRSQLDEAVDCPGLVDIGVRFYLPSLTRRNERDKFKDGRVAAQHKARLLFANWRREFYNDDDLRSQVLGMQLGIVDQGDHDRLGNPFWLPEMTGRTVLWVLAATARFQL